MQSYVIDAQTWPEQRTLVVTATLSVPEIGPWLGKAYGEIAGVLAGQGSEPAGPPFARYHPLGDGRHEVEAGFCVANAVEPASAVRSSVLPGGPVAVTTHIGSYDVMEPAYAALASWVSDRGGEPTGDPWEIYHSDPEQQPDPSTWRTEIVQPYRIPE
jgi:effector-binding domain-containing protein